ncbi:hypothetical protein CDD83_3615 [Cordyceps sp. RAO-2017]|nr:hypothetical protein CDD83_3615 [Cordyceps sp. RAO-2017]
MELLDPATGEALPSDAIQRVLFLAGSVHVYNIPPLASMRGHSASSWTADPARHIFTARLRVVETSSSASSAPGAGPDDDDDAASSLKVDVVLEDPATGQLFAAAPYTSAASVEPVVDSSRFFAVTVRDQAGRKAVLGIGFEERSDAFDLGVALQEARRILGWDARPQPPGQPSAAKPPAPARDYSLKEGETITLSLGNATRGRRHQKQRQDDDDDDDSVADPTSDLASFSLPPPPPPPSSSKPSESFALPPPPSAEDVKRKRRSLRDLGFDDGQFGEFA